MQIGDYIISSYGPVVAAPTVCRIRSLDPFTTIPITADSRHTGLNDRNIVEWTAYKWSELNFTPTLEEIADILRHQENINKLYEAEFKDYLVRRLVDLFGEPPKKEKQIGPAVVQGETAGFIRISKQLNERTI